MESKNVFAKRVSKEISAKLHLQRAATMTPARMEQRAQIQTMALLANVLQDTKEKDVMLISMNANHHLV